VSEALSLADFSAFFAELWTPEHSAEERAKPFPWQQRLVEEVAESGHWHDLLDLPTGSGKTASVDIAVFLMALRSDMPRRIVFVVDRRVVVDQAAQRARRLAELLEEPGNRPTVAAVAERLRRLTASPPGAEAAVPLVAAELRGGIARDASWALRPDVPAVLTSTVDQVGSRLLFRGYGVSPRMLPVHAGLLANDCLFLLDEVHLSQPFAQTLDAVRDRYRPPTGVLPDRWQVVRLSATPGADFDEREDFRTFELSDDDRDPEVAPILVRRLVAPKPACLRPVKVKKGADEGERRRALAQACVTEVGNLFEQDHIRTVAVVVNRVATAQDVHAALRHSWQGEENEEDVVLLLTGRMRPFDRDDLLHSHWHRLATGRTRDSQQSRLVMVATQAIEAGADLDVDGLVTECASLDSLRQRFGRVDRAGDMAANGVPSSSVIVATSAATAEDDPVYGGALANTWRWLSSQPVVDFGIQTVSLPERDELRELLAPRRDAPWLFPAHLDRWAQTSPVPSTDPDVALWLHGIGDVDRDVQVVWRADLERELLGGPEADVLRLVSACPPGSGEALRVPLAAVRRWLAGKADGPGDQHTRTEIVDVSDVEGARQAEEPITECAPFVRWRGDDSDVLDSPRRLVPGDTVVVPSSYGGIAFGSWDPTNLDTVADLGFRSSLVQRSRPTLRLVPQLVPAGLPPPPTAEEVEEGDLDPDEAIGLWIGETLKCMADKADKEDKEVPDPLFGVAVQLLAEKRNRRVQRLRAFVWEGDAGGRVEEVFIVTGVRRHRTRQDQQGSVVRVEVDPDTSSFIGRRIELHPHLDDVGVWARAVAAACDLPAETVADLELAGRLHDAGKADPRCQVMFWWPDRQPVGPGVELLAKSATNPSDRRQREQAQRESGYPQGARHELLSVALLESGGQSVRKQAADWELVLHLIASHHGHARPFVPVVIDPEPTAVGFVTEGVELRARTDHGLERLDSGIAHRYWSLVRRYGWFGLAWLETLLRLADHRASEMEETAETTRADA